MGSEEEQAAAENKRRFREALDRKKQQSGGKGRGSSATSTGSVHSAHGSAAHQKEFRRKSG